MHQGVAPAVDALKSVVVGAVNSLGVFAKQGGLRELVPTAGGQGHHFIGSAGSPHMGLQFAVGMDEGGKGLDGIKGHGKNGSEAQPI